MGPPQRFLLAVSGKMTQIFSQDDPKSSGERPADQLLRIGGVVAGWFISKDAISFTAVQMMFATIVLAAFIALIVFWQSVIKYCRSLWKSR